MDNDITAIEAILIGVIIVIWALLTIGVFGITLFFIALLIGGKEAK